jgi:hypothetical protein
MNLPTVAKAILAALIGGLAPVGITAATGPVTTGSVVASIVTALVGFGATYVMPKGKGADGIVVTLKTDASKFLAVIAAGLPALVEEAARAALAPEPVPVTPAVYTPPTVSSGPIDVSTPTAPSV